ncbi:MAG: hydroxyacid dehydrogenase [Cohnella sp.]|uniref:NAD(P)-dependent oxidoreductase n=1 Tax=Cohnella sp. TaxID=1883426 RepID=UPI000E379D45|nr:NAD(P)-dependent oxidoreductase [Cohnella sp.]REK63609.1 MAG: hydroxyacid dehydrogenase [Cohnella sp.]
MKRLVYSGPSHSVRIVEEALKGRFDIRAAEDRAESLLPEIERCAVFLDASMKVRLTAETIMNAKRLELVATATTGANHIDREALRRRGIPLLTLQGQTEFLRGLTPAAEHSWLLLMACARRLRGAVADTMRGSWDRQRFPGVMLRGKTLGIIGMGRIGTWMAKYADAFGMKVVGYDPYAGDFPPWAERADLDRLLAGSDFVSVHVHVTEETKGLLGADNIGKMKPGAVLVNTSRGEVIDEEALLHALRSGRIAAAGLDVLADEPDVRRSGLWQYARQSDRVIITPHIGGYCPEAVDRAVAFACGRILEHYGGSAT